MYRSKATLAEVFDLSRKTIDRRVEAMRKQLGVRYSPVAIIDTGRLVRVDEDAFTDWLKYGDAISRGFAVPEYGKGVR